MKVFISWSGPRSKIVADAFHVFVRRVIQASNPFLSSTDIEPGTRWFEALSSALDGASGVVILTRDNLTSHWIHWEAGALYKGLPQKRVWTLLVGIEPNEVERPLADFQRSDISRESVLALLRSINQGLPTPLPSEDLVEAFEQRWPKFNEEIQRALKESINTAPPKRDIESMVAEILTRVRSLRNIRIGSATRLNETGRVSIDEMSLLSARQQQLLVAIAECARQLDGVRREGDDQRTSYLNEEYIHLTEELAAVKARARHVYDEMEGQTLLDDTS